MAEFNFYITDKEREEFIDFILSKGSALIPDNSYSTSEFYEIKTLEELKENDWCGAGLGSC